MNKNGNRTIGLLILSLQILRFVCLIRMFDSKKKDILHFLDPLHSKQYRQKRNVYDASRKEG